MDENKRLQLIVEAVQYCRRVRALGMPASCYSKALREPVYFLWQAYGRGKARSAKYRSKAASGLRFGKREMIYDHAIPFAYLQSALLDLEPLTPEGVRDLLERYALAVLITTGEHDRLRSNGYAHRMPADWDQADPLARYRAVGIELLPNGQSSITS